MLHVAYYTWPFLCFIPVGLLGIVALSVDVLRYAGDLFPGRIRAVQAYLRWPSHFGAGETRFSVNIGRRQYHLWTHELYVLIGRWGLEQRYVVYLSPRTRRIWHVEADTQPTGN